jgi:hypothetical protein
LVIIASMLAGCTSGPSNTAIVHGLLVVPRATGFIPAGTVAVEPTSGVVLVVQGSKVVGRANVGESGKFSFRLTLGSYRLTGTLTPLPPGGKCQQAHVQARANTTVSVNVECHHLLGIG